MRQKGAYYPYGIPVSKDEIDRRLAREFQIPVENVTAVRRLFGEYATEENMHRYLSWRLRADKAGREREEAHIIGLISADLIFYPDDKFQKWHEKGEVMFGDMYAIQKRMWEHNDLVDVLG